MKGCELSMIVSSLGDILESNCDIIVHQVNCKGVMGAGLAKQIRDKYPNVYEEYKKFCDQDNLLGKAQFVPIAYKKYICNLFGQDDYGTGLQTDYEAFEKAIAEIKEIAWEHDFSIAIPYGIGCGLAGGSWDIISNIIDKYFEYSSVYCYIYKLKK